MYINSYHLEMNWIFAAQSFPFLPSTWIPSFEKLSSTTSPLPMPHSPKRTQASVWSTYACKWLCACMYLFACVCAFLHVCVFFSRYPRCKPQKWRRGSAWHCLQPRCSVSMCLRMTGKAHIIDQSQLSIRRSWDNQNSTTQVRSCMRPRFPYITFELRIISAIYAIYIYPRASIYYTKWERRGEIDKEAVKSSYRDTEKTDR